MRTVAGWDLGLLIASIVLGPISAVLWPLLILTVPIGIAALVLNFVLIGQALSRPTPALPAPPIYPGLPPS